jgi:hypothetical protein
MFEIGECTESALKIVVVEFFSKGGFAILPFSEGGFAIMLLEVSVELPNEPYPLSVVRSIEATSCNCGCITGTINICAMYVPLLYSTG